MGSHRLRLLPTRQNSRHRKGEEGFTTPLIVPVILLLILGAVTLASRTTSSFLTSTKQSDSLAARQAAESGMNRVLGALNPFSKSRVDPYLSFLLASRWRPGTGVDGSGWALTMESRAQVQSKLRQCGLSATGVHPGNVPPDGTQIYKDLLTDGVVGVEGASSLTQLRYRVSNYEPPTDRNLPNECSEFTSLSGGTAQISVEGSVVRRGRVMARYTLTRTVDVSGWSLPELPESWFDNVLFPLPPVGLRIAGQGIDLSTMSTAQYVNFATSTSPTIVSKARSLPPCRFCSGNGNAPGNGVQSTIPVADLFPANDTDLPRFPFNTDSPPLTPSLIYTSNLNYPFTGSTPNRSNLEPGCRPSEDIDSQRPGEIDCWIDRLGSARILRASRSGSTVTLTLGTHGFTAGSRVMVSGLTGQYASLNGGPFPITVTSSTTLSYESGSGDLSEGDFSGTNGPLVASEASINLSVNTKNWPVNLIFLNDVGEAANPVIIKHKTSSTDFFDHTDLSHRQRWSRLRLFGRKPGATACTNSGTSAQTLFIRADALDSTSASNPASLGGTFVWLPRGTLNYGRANGFTPKELLATWWVCNLTLNLSPPPSSTGSGSSPPSMTFIMPLSGSIANEVTENDSVTAILPGGYLNSSGAFTPDLRFPVYPQLMRIRSAY